MEIVMLTDLYNLGRVTTEGEGKILSGKPKEGCSEESVEHLRTIFLLFYYSVKFLQMVVISCLKPYSCLKKKR